MSIFKITKNQRVVLVWFFLSINIGSFSGAFAQSRSEYEYDALGRLISVRQTNGSYAEYAYDAAGNRIMKKVFRVDQFLRAWEAEDLPHVVGFSDDDGWAANVNTAQSFMTYGPYATDIPTGKQVAVWRMMIDNNNADNLEVAYLDVYDATTSEWLAARSITRKEFVSNWTYQDFYLPFFLDATRAGHAIEIRTAHKAKAHVRVDRLGLATSVVTGEELASGWINNNEAENLPHATGFGDDQSWAANIYSTPGHMTYGPYVVIQEGARTAVWRMSIDNNAANNRGIVKLEVYDATAGEIITQVTLFRTAWQSVWNYEYFGLPFNVPLSRAGHQFEFRTWFYGYAHVRVDKVGLK